MRILFICHGNICRSPMAEFVMIDLLTKANAKGVLVESAATSREEIGNDIHRGTKMKLDEAGIPYQKRKARQITPKDYDNFDLLLIMDKANERNAIRIFGDDKDGKIKSLKSFSGSDGDIADPWYTGNFDETYIDVLESCKGLMKWLGY
ncbi:MAG: low molecular weight protein-tyrosine-phosphatase [Anaerovoracaceae bacterium]